MDQREQLQNIVNFIKLNSPEDVMERVKIQHQLGVKEGVYFPSILGILANEIPGKIKVNVKYKDKEYNVVVEGVDEENLAVSYNNRLVGEIVEAGLAEELLLTFDDVVFFFQNSNNYYHPLESRTGDKYPTILAPFYKKEIIDENIFED